MIKNFTKNGIKLFKKHFWKDLDISSEYIWSIIGKVYNLNYDEIQSLIKRILITDNNWKHLIPYSHSFIYNN